MAIEFRICSIASSSACEKGRSARIHAVCSWNKSMRTEGAVHVLDGRVGPDRLVLTVDEHPEPEVGLGDLVFLGHPGLEALVGLVLEHAEAGQLGRRDVLVLKRGEVEALVLSEGVLGDDLRAARGVSASEPAGGARGRRKRERERERAHLGREVEVLLLLLALLRLGLSALVLQTLPEVRRGVRLAEGEEHLVEIALADVDEHVRIGEALGRASGVAGGVGVRVGGRVGQARDLAAVVVLEDLLVRDGRDSVIVVLEPLAVLLGFDESEVVAAVEVAGVDEDAVEFVDIRAGSVGVLVEVLAEVELERELVSVVDLR